MRSRWFVVMAAMAFLASAAWAQDCSKDTITVTGIGKVTVKPDVAYVTLRIPADGILMIDAAQKAKQKVGEVEKAIRAKQSSIKEIVVTDVSVGQKGSEWGPDEKEAPRPEIVKQMRVTIAPDPQVAHDIVDAAIRAGASMDISDSYSYGSLDSVIVYGLLDSDAAETQAQAKALEDAKSKASKLAALLGKAVGDVSNVGCEASSSWPYQFESIARGAGRFPTMIIGVDPSGIDITHAISVSFQMVKK